MITDIHSEDRLVQQTFAAHLETELGWENVYAYNTETFGPDGTLGRITERDGVLVRDLRAARERLDPALPASARAADRLPQAADKATRMSRLGGLCALRSDSPIIDRYHPSKICDDEADRALTSSYFSAAC